MVAGSITAITERRRNGARHGVVHALAQVNAIAFTRVLVAGDAVVTVVVVVFTAAIGFAGSQPWMWGTAVVDGGEDPEKFDGRLEGRVNRAA